MTSTLTARRVLTPDGLRQRLAISVDDGRIVSIEPTDLTPRYDLIAPGFIDLQVNGHDDVDVMSMNEQQWPTMRRLLIEQGVTTWLPTLVTTQLERYAERLDHLRRFADDPVPGPTLAGVHLEGPYLGRRHGAHRNVPDGAIDLDWLATLPDLVKLVTLGPERENAVEATRLLVSRGVVVALGHTSATYEEVLACVDAGARLFTHCFNATSPLHHRAPGPLGAALSCDDLAISLIADNVHVHPAIVRIAARSKPEGMTILVTDAAGWRAGRLGRERIEVRDGGPRLIDGTLAGSNLTMVRAVRNAADDANLGIEAALRAATGNPARLLGLGDRGTIEIGRRADLVALDAAGEVAGTWVAGQRVGGRRE
jgi:N-acetylglucosamine-6-phosphate deacetylase